LLQNINCLFGGKETGRRILYKSYSLFFA